MDHYYSKTQSSKIKLGEIKTLLRNKEFTFLTSSGVFSKTRIDLGTEILINNCILNDNWNVLDLGCGIGVVGIVVKSLFPNTKVTMVDINERAIDISEKNADKNDVDCDIFQSDIYNNIKNKRFDTIICNPPQHAGKDVCFKIIEDAPVYLEKHGLLQIVCRHNKGGRTLEKKMLDVFGNVKHIVKKSGYRVYVSEKR